MIPARKSTTKYDIKYAFRKYEIQGKEKTYWSHHGTLFVEDETGRMSIKIDSLPVVKEFEGWFQVFKQETPEELEKRFGSNRKTNDSFQDDDLSF